jgi:predicted dinucleotide-binding enzyme/DMSO/TMAO reductase YedYZ heme-binding membrane subunit
MSNRTELGKVHPGTGNYARAISKRLACSGITVVIGSRDPAKAVGSNAWSSPFEHVSHTDAIRNAEIVILAIPYNAYESFVTENAFGLQGKTLVDVTNPVTPGLHSCMHSIIGRSCGGGADRITGDVSSAQNIQAKLFSLGAKDVHVVKAFNATSAYELGNMAARLAPPIVTVSGDSEAAKLQVMNLARRMGYTALDFGGIENSIIQERTVHRFFERWVSAVIVSVVVLLVLTIYWANKFYMGKKAATSFWLTWLLRPVGDTSAIVLSLSFLPGSIAGFWQLVRGTAKRPFPSWFGSWLNIRKQLGLLAFFLAAMHALGGCLQGTPPSASGKPTFNEYTYISFGAMAFVFFGILAVCSVSSAAQGQMSWLEYKFVFGALGYATLALVIVHISFMMPGRVQAILSQRKMATSIGYQNNVLVIYLSIAITGLVMMLKIILCLPPLSWRLSKVRAL